MDLFLRAYSSTTTKSSLLYLVISRFCLGFLVLDLDLIWGSGVGDMKQQQRHSRKEDIIFKL